MKLAIFEGGLGTRLACQEAWSAKHPLTPTLSWSTLQFVLESALSENLKKINL